MIFLSTASSVAARNKPRLGELSGLIADLERKVEQTTRDGFNAYEHGRYSESKRHGAALTRYKAQLRALREERDVLRGEINAAKDGSNPFDRDMRRLERDKEEKSRLVRTARMVGVPTIHLDNMKTSLHPDGSRHFYFGGVGRADGLGHGHIVIETAPDGSVTKVPYCRLPECMESELLNLAFKMVHPNGLPLRTYGFKGVRVVRLSNERDLVQEIKAYNDTTTLRQIYRLDRGTGQLHSRKWVYDT